MNNNIKIDNTNLGFTSLRLNINKIKKVIPKIVALLFKIKSIYNESNMNNNFIIEIETPKKLFEEGIKKKAKTTQVKII